MKQAVISEINFSWGVINKPPDGGSCTGLVSFSVRKILCTVIVARMSHRKWRETKQHLI